jgi:nucleoside-diphosphate-sugar epimerase
MMEKILVTGAGGFLGKHVMRKFKKVGYNVIGVDLKGSDYNVDVTDFEAFTDLVKRVSPSLIIHLAALVSGDLSLKAPYEYFKVNTLGTLNVFESCRKMGINKVIYMSSLSPFGPAIRINETTPFDPRNPYGGSKAAAEYIARTYAICYGIKTLIFRAPLIAGEEQTEYNAIQEFVDCVLNSRPIVIFGKGDHKREWLHPDDVVDAFIAGIKYLDEMNKPYDIFTLGSGNPISMNQLAELVMKVLGRKVQVVHTKMERVYLDQITDTSKSNKILKWYPKIGVEEIIRRVAEYRSRISRI